MTLVSVNDNSLGWLKKKIALYDNCIGKRQQCLLVKTHQKIQTITVVSINDTCWGKL